MTSFSGRTDKSHLGGWWWSVDRWAVLAILMLVGFGLVLVSAASPSVAVSLGLPPFHFVERHISYLIISLCVMFGMSMLSRKSLWRAASVTLVGAMVLVVISILFGSEIKGATRWVRLFGFSLQPSEFMKPAFAVVCAWLVARQQYQDNFPGQRIVLGVFALSMALLLLQPDFGMAFVLATIWGVQIFLSGLPMMWVAVLGVLGGGFVVGAYVVFPHVASRIDRFLDPASGDNYQVQKSLEAFSNGGLFGTGAAHGQVKRTLPDAHADFIFAVVGEEFGLIVTLVLVAVFCFIIIRSVMRILNSDDLFIVLGVGGLLTQFAVQSLIHMGSSLQLLPAKGMTLPFISYGGSSMLSLGFAIGMLLSLTRKRAETAQIKTWKNGSVQETYG